MLKKLQQLSPMISRVNFYERTKAFATIAMTVLVLLCLFWPLSVSGFRSVAGINLESNTTFSKQQLQRLLVAAVQKEATPERLETIIGEVESTERIRTQTVEQHDFESIRRSIQIGVNKQGNECRLQVVFDGAGQRDDRKFVDILAARVAQRLMASDPIEDKMESTPREPIGRSQGFQSDQLRNYEQANLIVNQFQDELDAIKRAIEELPEHDVAPNSSDPTHQTSRFKLASTSRRTDNDVTEIRDSLESIDVASLRVLLVQMKTEMVNRAETSMANQASHLKIASLSLSKSSPIGGVPTIQTLMMLATFAGTMGAIVAWQFNPFETRGFKNTESIAKKLQIPILATIRDPRYSQIAAASSERESEKANWANRAVNIAGLILFGVFVVLAVFLITNLEVRTAFFENPFFGVAKMVRTFAGY